jgi:hypothetical protein
MTAILSFLSLLATAAAAAAAAAIKWLQGTPNHPTSRFEVPSNCNALNPRHDLDEPIATSHFYAPWSGGE